MKTTFNRKTPIKDNPKAKRTGKKRDFFTDMDFQSIQKPRPTYCYQQEERKFLAILEHPEKYNIAYVQIAFRHKRAVFQSGGVQAAHWQPR